MTKSAALARTLAAATLIPLIATQQAWAWGQDGHKMINRLAVEFLPADVPLFLRDAKALDTIEYLGPEPDRWKNRAEKELGDTQSPDHFFDSEWAVYAATPCAQGSVDCVAGYRFPRERYDFIRALAAAQPAHPAIKLQENVGFQPWQVEEVWERLKADLREYRRLVADHKATAPAEVAVVFDAGWLGHYVGDGSQPLHTTIQYNGWTGPNPNGYTTDHQIHALFESTFVTANIKRAEVAPLVAASKVHVIDDEWTSYLGYLHHTNSLVDETYRIEKAGGFVGAGTAEGKAFAEERLAAGAIELRDLIDSAWVHSADPVEEYKGPK